nr:uncharacterized protein LOC119175479 [Rhipicephalus microplus]
MANKFCDMTGSVINWHKTTAFWYGNWDVRPEVYLNVKWESKPLEYLGVPLDSYRDNADYWKGEAETLRQKTNAWGGRDLSIFARATVCNMFLISKIWYVMQVICMSRVNVQKFHRIFAVFVWKSPWERTSRSNLFQSVSNGGLGLCHLFIRQVVSRFIFLRDQRNKFLQTVIKVRLSSRIPDFVVSTDSGMCRYVSGFLREVIQSFEFLKVRFSLEYLATVKRKKLYRDLRDVLLPTPLYRSMFNGGPGQDVLKRVKKMKVKAGAKTFFFKLHSGTLPVKQWLADKGIDVPWTTNCLLCKTPETIDHVFIHCWDAVFHWDILQRTLKKDLPITSHGIRFLCVDEDDGIPYDMVMLISLHSIWQTTMAYRHLDQNIRPVRENFIANMRYITEVYKQEEEPPSWLTMLEELCNLKKF